MKTKVIVCPNKEVGGTPINYIVEYYGVKVIGGIAARNGWHVHPREAYERKPYYSTVVTAENLESYLASAAKTCTIERW